MALRKALLLGLVMPLALVAAADASQDEADRLAQAESRLAEARANVASLEKQAPDPSVVKAARMAVKRTGAANDRASAELEAEVGRTEEERDAAAQSIESADAAYKSDYSGWSRRHGLVIGLVAFLVLTASAVAGWRSISNRLGPVLNASAEYRPIAAGTLGLAAFIGFAVCLKSDTSASAAIAGLIAGIAAALCLVSIFAGRGNGEGDEATPFALRSDQVKHILIGVGCLSVVLILGSLVLKPSKPVPDEATLALAAAGNPRTDPTPELQVLLDAQEEAVQREQKARSAYERLTSYSSDLADARQEQADAEREVARWQEALAEPDPDVAIRQSLGEFFAAYNSGDYVTATSYIDESQKCGSEIQWADAFRQNHETERIDYSVTDVEITSVKQGGNRVDADVTIQEADSGSGKILSEQAQGFTFLKNDFGEWVQDENYPIGVPVFCP